MSITNIYLPKFNPGPTSSYTQALNTIRKMKGWESATGIEEYFYNKLQESIREDFEQGYRQVVGGDFNDDHSTSSKMTKQMETVGLINVSSPPT